MTENDQLEAAAVVFVPVLDRECRFIIEGYQDDSSPNDFQAAIQNFLSLTPETLADAEEHVYQYYKRMNDMCWNESDDEYLRIQSPSDVWKHVEFGVEPLVVRRKRDNKIYISLECECDWEPEHGLQIVFKEGIRVNKIGGYDGHLSNSDAYADPRLEDVIYRK